MTNKKVTFWRAGSDGAKESHDYGFKSHVRCNLQDELL